MHTDHERFRQWVSADLDNELSPADQALLTEHLAACEACRTYAADISGLKTCLGLAAFKSSAPLGLAGRIRTDLARAQKPWLTVPTWLRPLGLPLTGAALAIMAGAVLLVHAGDMTPDLIRGHVEAVAAQHITDIASADQDTLRPWFAAQVDYIPPLLDAKAAGCALLGGRVENIRQRKTAALAYQCQGHMVTVYVEPSDKGRSAPNARTQNGYQLVSWRGPKLACQAVSDLNTAGLLRLATYIQSNAGKI